MKLVEIKIEGFRNIISNTLKLGKITSLVSSNSYGKSNLISAIEFAINFIKNDVVLKQHMMQWRKGVPLNKHVQNKNFKADFILETEMNNKNYTVNYGFEFEWIKDKDNGKKIVGEWLSCKLNEKNQKFTTLIKRDSSKAYIKQSENARCSTPIDVKEYELVVNELNNNKSLYYYDLLNSINNINVYIERHLDITSSFEINPIVMKTYDSSDLSEITNIARAIYTINKDYPNKYELIIDTYKQLFPNIESIYVKEVNITPTNLEQITDTDIPFTIEDVTYVLYVKDRNLNQPINFENLSDGSKRVFLMLTYAILADINGLSLIAFEEPENSIHPSLLQSYLDVLMQFTNNCNILLTSHSPYILQYVNTEDIYIGIPNNNGIADFKRIANKKVKSILNDAYKYGDSIGGYIFDLLSGADDEIDILKSYMEI